MTNNDKRALEDKALDLLFSNASLPPAKKGFADEVMMKVLNTDSVAEKRSPFWKEWLLPALQLGFSVFVILTYDWTANSASNIQDNFVNTDMVLLEGLPSETGLASSSFNFSTALGLSTEDLI